MKMATFAFISCRSSCCDFNVVRQCSYTLYRNYSHNALKNISDDNSIQKIRHHYVALNSAIGSWKWRSTNNKLFPLPRSAGKIRISYISTSCSRLGEIIPQISYQSFDLKNNLYTMCSYHATICVRCCSNLRSQSRQSSLAQAQPLYFHFSFPRYFSGGQKHSHTHYYDVLGLTSKASQKQIKTAYYGLSKKYHPDVAQDKRSHALFTEINEAYEVLGNIRKRRMYDKGMFSHRDQRVYDYDEEDYTQSYKKKTSQSPYERGNRPPPPTGRSKIYNFDEFYKQHYNDIRQRRRQEYEHFKRYKEMDEFNRERQRQQRNRMGYHLLVPACLSLLVTAIILNNQLYDYDNIGRKNGNGKR